MTTRDAPPPALRELGYEPALDGVRAFAIVAVMAYHAAPTLLPGGFLGVDVFYVLSGYLITAVVLRQVAGGAFTVREFLLRRVQRLLPNALVMLVATSVLAAALLLPSAGVSVARHALFTMANLSNVYVLRTFGSYFGEAAGAAPLLHTWSLAVEEQFYLVFPLAVSALLRISRNGSSQDADRTAPALFAGASLVGILSLLLGWLAPPNAAAAAFYMLPTRAFEPLVGVALAARAARGPTPAASRARSVSGVAGCLGGLAAVFGPASNPRFPGTGALLATSATALVLFALEPRVGRLSRTLGAAPCAWLGRRSYSLYLWHWPLIALAHGFALLGGRSPTRFALFGLLTAVPVALVTYRYVERPLRQRGEGRDRRLVMVAGMATASATLLAFLAARPAPLGASAYYDPVTFDGRAFAVGPAPGRAKPLRYADVRMASALAPMAYLHGGLVRRHGGGRTELAVVGSSHALPFAALIDAAAAVAHRNVLHLSVDGAAPYLDGHGADSFGDSDARSRFDRLRLEALALAHPRYVFVGHRWDVDDVDEVGFERWVSTLVGDLRNRTDHVVLLTQVPTLALGETENLREFVRTFRESHGIEPRIHAASDDARRRRRNAVVRRLGGRNPEVVVCDVAAPFERSDGTVRYADGRRFFYADDDHLSDAGAREASTCIDRLVRGTR